jgi:Icc-related predicted phosphoesterase
MSPLFGKKTPRTTLYFASDIHGSEKCFRKFLNGAKIYEANVAVLGGDVAGKAIQAITETPTGHYDCTFRGAHYEVDDGQELVELEQLIADFGYYAYRAQPGELEQRVADDTMEALFINLMKQRLEHWMELADERLRPLGIEAYWMLGNDDPEDLGPVLDAAPWGTHCDGKVLMLGSGHEFLSYGPSNATPWNSYRERSEDEIAVALEKMATELQAPERAIFNVHVPPYDSGLDEAPVLDANLTVQSSAGQVKMMPVGSKAVRAAIEKIQPMLGIHGHVHESSGARMIGKTLCINPGSDYGTAVLNGFIATLESDRVRAHQFVRG